MFNLIYLVWYGLMAVVAIGLGIQLLVKQWCGWHMKPTVDDMIKVCMEAREAVGSPITETQAREYVLRNW